MKDRKDYHHQYYLKNKKRILDKTLKYQIDHPEVNLRAQKKYREKDRKEYNRKNREWSKNHPVEVRRWARNSARKLRQELIALLGDSCSNPNCPIPKEKMDQRCLQIDHINGGGLKEIRNFTSTSAYYRFIRKKIESSSKDYQLLCPYCNWLKRFTNGEVKSLE